MSVPAHRPPLRSNLSEDNWRGDAQGYVSIDGQRLGGLQTITASHAAGQTQRLSFMVPLSTGAHIASVELVNDAWGGTPATDRNLYFDSFDFGSQHNVVNAALYANGSKSFTIPASAETAPGAGPLPAGPLTIDTSTVHAFIPQATY